uniref:Uncharacterized protein n=1 Tax=Micrurus carvalhoi TaxID=3147026 RepID=A0A2H6NB81_9SAUR
MHTRTQNIDSSGLNCGVFRVFQTWVFLQASHHPAWQHHQCPDHPILTALMMLPNWVTRRLQENQAQRAPRTPHTERERLPEGKQWDTPIPPSTISFLLSLCLLPNNSQAGNRC